MFLIHYVITQYTASLLSFLDLSLGWVENSCIIIAELIGTVALSLTYMRIRKERYRFSIAAVYKFERYRQLGICAPVEKFPGREYDVEAGVIA